MLIRDTMYRGDALRNPNFAQLRLRRFLSDIVNMPAMASFNIGG